MWVCVYICIISKEYHNLRNDKLEILKITENIFSQFQGREVSAIPKMCRVT